jgi:hypothetical protein
LFIEKDAIERKKRQDEVDHRLDKQYEFIREAALQASVAIVWNDDVPFVEKTKAAFLSIKLGANGNLRGKFIQMILKEPNGIKTFRSLLSTYKRESEHNISKHFTETIDWIEKQLH